MLSYTSARAFDIPGTNRRLMPFFMNVSLMPVESSGSIAYRSLRYISPSYLRSTTATYVDNDRQQLDFRLRGRQMSLKVSADQIDSTWRLGSPRADIKPDGRR